MHAVDAYRLRGSERLDTPCLVYYRDRVSENIRRAVDMASGPKRLWPHVKSHKIPEMIRLQESMGIRRFKCATIAEAEMTAQCGAEDVLLAYPLVGTATERFLKLCRLYPVTRFWAIGDDCGQLRRLSEMSAALGMRTRTLLDLDLGTHRTGVPLEDAAALYSDCSRLPGLELLGFHGYDGHLHQTDAAERAAGVDGNYEKLDMIEAALGKAGLSCPVKVMGGSPTFAFHARRPGVFLSPGTFLLWDHGYASHFPDLPFTPAAVLATRVISHYGRDRFTLDLGYKAVASDPAGVRGVITGMEKAVPLEQNEEHWMFSADGEQRPAIGDVLYVIPTHICPTSALHESVLVAKDDEIEAEWNVTARRRKITV